jgi:hypothetical protein
LGKIAQNEAKIAQNEAQSVFFSQTQCKTPTAKIGSQKFRLILILLPIFNDLPKANKNPILSSWSGSPKSFPRESFGLACMHLLQSRVARWHIFKPKIPIWVNFGGSCNGRFSCIMWPLVLFYSYLVYFVAICYILWLFGIFYNYFGIFYDYFNIFFPHFWSVVPRKIWQPCSGRCIFFEKNIPTKLELKRNAA